MPTLTANEKLKIITRYRAGELAAPLAREFGVSSNTVHKIIAESGATKHSRTYTQRRGHTLNDDAFDTLTETPAYKDNN